MTTKFDWKTRFFVAWFLVLVCISFLGSCQRPSKTEPTAGMQSQDEIRMRVLLLDDSMQFTLQAEPGFIAQQVGNQNRKGFSSNTVSVVLNQGSIQIDDFVFNSEVLVRTVEPYIFRINGNPYRGNLHIKVNSDMSSLTAVNHVPLEAYLAGVVGEEMPSYWEPEALKAQAVAARTYALYTRRRFGADRDWDVRKTQANQVYGGVNAENPRIWKVVKTTHGQILQSIDENGRWSIFPTYYHSTCGGHTESSRNVFGKHYNALAAVEDPYCGKARSSLLNWASDPYPISQISNRILERYPYLNHLQKIVDVQIDKQSQYPELNRITKFKLLGVEGRTATLRAEDVRLTLDPTGRNIKSTACTIQKEQNTYRFVEGRGFGHGVGMCQYGAQGMARQDTNYQQILSHYYPGSRLITQN